MKSMSKMTVAIVGGGIAGTALALGLSGTSGVDIKLFETAPAFGEIGAGVSFGANAVQAIKKLGIGDEYAEIADSTPAPWQDIWFEWRHAEDGSQIGASVAPGVGESSVHRADFIDLLAARLPAGVANLGKHVTGFVETGDRVHLQFADGETFTADVLIAADGIKSALRNPLLAAAGHPPAHPRFTGTSAFRGLVATDILREAFRSAGLDEHLLNVPQMLLAENSHVLTFPVKKGRFINIVAFVSDRSSANATWPDDLPWVKHASKDELLASFASSGLEVRTLLGCIEKPTLWALHDLDQLPTYVHGRVALIGDAAHAMLPHQGAGAGQGLEDAYFLACLLGTDKLSAAQIPALLKLYDDLRRARASRVQQTSWEAGELYEYQDPVAGRDTARLKEVLESRLDWVWHYNLEDDIASAQQLLRSGANDAQRTPVAG